MSSSLVRDLVRFDARGRDRDLGDGKESVWEALALAGVNLLVRVTGVLMAAVSVWVWLLVYVPVLAVGCLCLGLLTYLAGTTGLLIGLGWAAVVAGLAAFFGRELLFDHVEDRVARYVRRFTHRWRWDDLMSACGLTTRDATGEALTPRLMRVHPGRDVDVLDVRLSPGVTDDDLATATEAIASDLRALDARVLPHARRSWIQLQVITRDLLATPFPAVAPPVECGPNVTELHIGWREDGQPWLLSLLGAHLLVAGATGAGKSGVLAQILVQLAPAIRDGWVRVIGIDPKGGMEFGMYAELFYLLAADSQEDLVVGLEVAARLTAERTQELRGVVREHTPSREQPFYLVVIDEVASITAYMADRKLKERARQALGTLLTTGRAPGVSVIGCVQDPRKEVIDLRNLFPLRLALRLTEKTEVAMVLRDGARDRGARADRIPMSTPGVGYLVEDGDNTITRVRAGYVTDEQLRWVAHRFSTPTKHSHDDRLH
jgi:S-DNA-T family DNA segregation ATPase FtsK/SpoIIIE